MALRALILILVLGGAGAYARTLGTGPVLPPALPELDRLPMVAAGWVGEDHPLDPTAASVLRTDAHLLRLYRNARGGAVWVFLAYFREQQVGSQIHSPRNCVPGGGWTVLESGPSTVPTGAGPLVARRLVVQRNDLRQTMLYWFRTRSGVVNGEYRLKLDLVRNALARRPTDALFVRYHAAAGSEADLHELMEALRPPLEEILGEIGL